MANDWHSARPAVQDRWAGEITPLTPVGRQSPAVPAASMQSGTGMPGGARMAPSGAAAGVTGGMAGNGANSGTIGGMTGSGMTGGMVSAGNNGGTQMESGQQMAGESNGLDMTTGLPDEVIVAPTTVSEAYLGSLKALLNNNKGNYVVAAFLIGNQAPISWEGILYDVGNDFITIYQEARNRYIVCDIYSLKFIEFYDVQRQRQ